MIQEVLQFLRKYPLVIVLLIVCWLANISLLVPFSISVGHDTHWHLALISVAFKSFPPQIPIFAGETLKGYNYLLDFIMFLFTKIGIADLYVYMIVMPLIYLTSMTFLSIYFAKKLRNSVYFVSAFVFFIFMATPFSYVLSYMKRGNIFEGFKYPTTMQSISALTNMSHAMTLPLILIAMIILLHKKLSKTDTLILGILVLLTLGIKFYGGAVLLFLVGINVFIRTFTEKDIKAFFIRSIYILICAGVSIVLFYDPFSSSKTGSIFGYAPLATVHPLIEDPDSLTIPYFVNARYFLQNAGGFSPRLVFIELITIAIYITYNAGTRIVGVIEIIKRIFKKELTSFELSIIATIIFSAAMSIMFVQKGGDWWNTVQFFGYTLFLFNIYPALFIDDVLKKITIPRLAVVGILVLLTLPLNIELMMKSITGWNLKPHISSQEKEALSFLKKQKDGTVYTVPPMYSSAYVPALSHKPVYYADTNVLSNIGVDYEDRLKMVENYKKIPVEQLNMSYYYMLKTEQEEFLMSRDQVQDSQLYEILFENNEVVIYGKK